MEVLHIGFLRVTTPPDLTTLSLGGGGRVRQEIGGGIQPDNYILNNALSRIIPNAGGGGGRRRGGRGGRDGGEGRGQTTGSEMEN